MHKILRRIVYVVCGMMFFSNSLTAQEADESNCDIAIINKNYPSNIAAEVQMALSYYPELAETPIDFVYKTNIKNAYMQAQPKWHGVFQARKKRAYVIKMTPVYHLGDEEVPLKELPEEVIVGWLVHELGHIMDYSGRSGLGMVGFGINYITSDKFKVRAERAADMHAIIHGTADHIVACKNFIYNQEGISKSYRNRIKRLYMSPDTVLQLAEKHAQEMREEEASSVN